MRQAIKYITMMVLMLFFLLGGTGINVVHTCHHCHHETAEQAATCHCHHGDHDCCWFKHLQLDEGGISQHVETPASDESENVGLAFLPGAQIACVARKALFDAGALTEVGIVPLRLGRTVLATVCRWIL